LLAENRAYIVHGELVAQERQGKTGVEKDCDGRRESQ
jgi:hypothetical protein